MQFARNTSDTQRRRMNTMTDERFTEQGGGADHVRVTGLSAGLQRLHELRDYDVAEGNVDVRGWEVRTIDGQALGTVNDLIVSVAELRVRYLDIDVQGGGHALIPIEAAQLDNERDDVVVRDVSVIRRDYRRAGWDNNGRFADAAHERIDRERRTPAQLDHARADAQRAQQPAAQQRAEGPPVEQARIDADEAIRIPVRHEEAVVRKRPVFREEIVIRRRMVTDNVPVETDLRRERIDVDGAVDRTQSPRSNP